MKKHFGIKLLLLGIALITFFPYAERFMDIDQSIIEGIIAAFGAYSPLIGLVLCVAGLFVKDKTNDSDFMNTEEMNDYFGIKESEDCKNKKD